MVSFAYTTLPILALALSATAHAGASLDHAEPALRARDPGLAVGRGLHVSSALRRRYLDDPHTLRLTRRMFNVAALGHRPRTGSRLSAAADPGYHERKAMSAEEQEDMFVRQRLQNPFYHSGRPGSPAGGPSSGKPGFKDEMRFKNISPTRSDDPGHFSNLKKEPRPEGVPKKTVRWAD